jgi:hypothetical protein
MIEAIEAIEAILTWTPGYSPRAFDSSPGAGFGGSASGGSGAHADCASDGHGSPSRRDACAERASCATHQTKGHRGRATDGEVYMEMEMGWKLIVGRCWEGEDQLDIIWYNYIDHLLRIYFDLNGCGVRVWIHSNIEDPERPMENKHLVTSKIWGSVLQLLGLQKHRFSF